MREAIRDIIGALQVLVDNLIRPVRYVPVPVRSVPVKSGPNRENVRRRPAK